MVHPERFERRTWIGRWIHTTTAMVLGVVAAGCSTDTGEVQQRFQAQIPTGQEQSLTELVVSLPSDLYPQDVALGALSSLRVSDRAHVLTDDAEPKGANVANSGSGLAYLGVNSRVGDLTSAGRIELRNNAIVEGDAITALNIHEEPGASIQGESLENQSVAPFRESTWTPEFEQGPGGDINLEPHQATTLAPGSFGALNVKSRAQITLQPGNYHFTRVHFESDSKLILASTERSHSGLCR